MKRIFKKKLQLTVTMIMAMTSQINGIDCNPSTCCEPTCCDTMASAISFDAELLYWRPELCGLESAFGDTTITNRVNQNAVTITTVKETDKEPDFKWNAGFRIGADVTWNCFDVELDWTHFNGHAKFHEGTQHGHWNIKYDTVDLTFGHHFRLASCFDVKPFIGVRGIQVHQKLTSHLETLFISPLIGNNTILTDKHDREDFWGVGPQIGLDANWLIGCNFSLYGSFAVVSYYGDVKGGSCNVDSFTSTISVCDGRKKHCFNTVGTDAALGIRWDSSPTCCCGCDVDFMLKLGVEQHRIYDFSDLGSDGNLSLDGGIFAAGVSFSY